MPEAPSPPVPTDPLVGRDRPLAELHAVLADVRAGQRGVVLLEGEPGIGKTSLIRQFASSAGATVVWASGDEAEADLDYGLLDQLVRGAPPVSHAGIEPETAGDPLRAGASLVRLVDALDLQRSHPLLVVIDDVQWADAPSLQALAFAARRLRRDPLLLCLIRREDPATPLPSSWQRLVSDEGVRLHLGPLDRAAVSELAEGMLGEAVTVGTATRLLEHTGGHPLHLRALLGELTPEGLRDAVDLPVPRSFRSLVLARLAGCTAEVEALIAALAVLGEAVPMAVVAEVADLDDPLQPLDEAVGRGLVVDDTAPSGPMIALSHPLVRAAVLDDLPRARLTALHRRAGAVLDDPAGLRHRLLGTVGSDEDLWEQARSAARHEARRGAHGSAAALHRAAIPVAPTEAARSDSLLAAVDQLLLAGRPAAAASLGTDVDGALPSARRSYTLGRLAYITGPRREARDHLEAAWAALHGAAGLDVPLAGQVAAMLATVQVDRADGAAAERWCTRALELAPEEAAAASVAHMLAGAHALQGTFDQGLDALDRVLARAAGGTQGDGAVARADALTARGLLRLWCHDLDDAAQDLTTALGLTAHVGSSVARESARFYLAEVRYRQGRWDDAILLAEQAASIAEDSDQSWMAALPHGTVARPLAARGEAAGRQHAERALVAARAIGAGVGITLAQVAALEVAVCGRDHPRVLAIGDELQAIDAPMHERIGPWRLGYVEALVAMGRIDDATRVADDLGAHAATALARSDAAAARVIVVSALDDTASADVALAEGLALPADEVGPYPRARLELVAGRAWRRRGERRRAHDILQAARARFSELGAEPWIDQVDVELAASGLRPSRRPRSAGEPLTPQEQAVARLVARGLTNREVATELVLSAKTVEHHLSRVYAKLGLRSRTELAARPHS